MSVAKEFAADWITGGITAAVCKTLLAPLERIKIIMQVQQSMLSFEKLERVRYKGVWDFLKRAPKEDGFFSLWRGNLTNISRYFPTQAFNFAFRDLYKHYLLDYRSGRQETEVKAIRFILCGSLAGVSTHCIVFPLVVCHTKISAELGKDGREYYTLRECVFKIIRSSGFSGLYTGFFASVSGISVYRGIYFGLFDIGKDHYRNLQEELSFIQKLLLAQICTWLASSASLPLDTISRLMMLQARLPKNERKKFTAWIRHIHDKHGYLGFYNGFSASLLKSLSSALVISLFDEISHYYKKPVPVSAKTDCKGVL